MGEPLRVLHIVGAMYPGGFENFIMNLYEKIDTNKIQFDMVVHIRRENDYVERIEQMGGKVFVIPRLTTKPILNLKQLYHIVKEHHYQIVIRHTSNALVVPQMIVAKWAGAKIICHSHNETDPKQLFHKFFRMFMGAAVTECFACSKKAGEWMYGTHDYKIIKNAINIQKFVYHPEKEKKIRDEFGIGERKVYGNIANFIESKNHKYLLSIFKEIAKRDNDAIFFCVGEGELRPEIEKEILRLQLTDKVILPGSRNDIENFMACFDVLIFPSRFEGLPLTLIEAQAAALPCLISDVITKEVMVTEHILEKESIEVPSAIWAERAMEMAEKNRDKDKRYCQYESIEAAGYDINALAKWYEEYLVQMIGK